MAGWYVRRGEKIIGPIEVDQLKESAAAGKLLPTDLLAKDIAGPWTEAGKTTLFENASQASAPNAPRPTAIILPAEKPPIVVVAEPEQQPASPSKGRVIARVITHQLAQGTRTFLGAVSSTLATRAQRKHEIKLAKINAQAIASANQPSVPQKPQPTAPPTTPRPVVIAPQVVQTTVVKIVNHNNHDGCGCTGCLLLLLIAVIAAMVFASWPEGGWKFDAIM